MPPVDSSDKSSLVTIRAPRVSTLHCLHGDHGDLAAMNCLGLGAGPSRLDPLGLACLAWPAVTEEPRSNFLSNSSGPAGLPGNTKGVH